MRMENQTQTTHKGDGHRGRLRERFLTGGLSGFHDYEVLELLLSLNTPRKDTKQAAKDLLIEFKTFQGVLEATPEALGRVHGVGPVNSLGIQLIKAVSDRYLESRILHRDVVKDPASLVAFLNHFIGYKDKEHFLGIFLDAKNRVVASDILFTGSLTASAVYPREVIIQALAHRAAAVIFAHNHPSGDTQPSKTDIQMTRNLVFALTPVGIIVHEHIITGGDGYYSFAAQGLITQFIQELDQLR